MDPKEERQWDLWVDRCVESATDLYMGDDEPDEEPPCPKQAREAHHVSQGPAGIHIPTVYVATPLLSSMGLGSGLDPDRAPPSGSPLRGGRDQR